ncbi:MAG: amidohydrolase family protein [Desulfarculaceae bacterium]
MQTAIIIDAHVHVTPDGNWFGTGIDASEGRLLKEMEQTQLSGAVVLPVYGLADDLFVAGLCRRYPQILAGFAMPDFKADMDPMDQVRRAFEEYGLKGVKLHPGMQNLDPNDPRLEPLLNFCALFSLPVMFCTNLGPSEISLQRLGPFCYEELARRHPETTIILAHAGVHRVLDAYWVAKRNPNVYLEISMVLSYLQGTSVMGDLLWVTDKLDRKVIYGSDFPENALKDYLALLDEGLIGHPECNRSAVVGENILGLINDWPVCRDQGDRGQAQPIM